MKLAGNSRRRFLNVVSAGAMSVACSGDDESSGPQMVGDVDAGNVSALAVGALRIVPGAPVAIGRDDQGVYAMTTTCTHQGCDMSHAGSVTSNGLHCNCHGSSFDVNGGVTGGPAHTALAHFAVDIDQDGVITVHTDNVVSASDRTSPG
jgi:Rieske Fe-S protein